LVMIGQTLVARRPFPWGATLSLLLGLALASGSLALGQWHGAVGAILPVAVGGFLWRGRPPAWEAYCTEDGLPVLEPPASVPYGTIEGLWAKGRSGSFPIQVAHAGGILWIPARLDVPSAEVYRFLLGRFSAGGGRDVHPRLRHYLHQQEQTFGPDRVWSFRARHHPGNRFGAPTCRALA